MPNFTSRGFKIKEIYVIVLSISSVYLLVQVTRLVLASDDSDIQACVEDSDLSIQNSPQIYATYFLILI